MSELPNPGSKEARELGCKCPTIDNAHGRGIYVSGAYRFVTVHGCPLHWPTESESSSPMTLAEATETARRILAADPNGKSALLPVIATLLQAGRRVQAMEAAGGLVDELRSILNHAEVERFKTATIDTGELRAILDLASDQSAARARVAILETNNARLTETSMARFRTIERITTATRADVSNDVRLDLVRDALTAAKVTP